MNIGTALSLLNRFGKAARKQKKALESGWGHAVFCNYQRDEGNGHGRCNCGVADMLSVLKAFDAPEDTKAEIHSMLWGRPPCALHTMKFRGRVFRVTPADILFARSQTQAHNITSTDGHAWKENSGQFTRTCVKCFRYEKSYTQGEWTPLVATSQFSTEDIEELIKING